MQKNNRVKFDLVFVVTCTNDSFINALVKSIIDNRSLRIFIIVILQNNVKLSISENPYNIIKCISISNVISLSAARNIGLQYLHRKNIDYKYIMFPDDDSSFDSSFFLNFKNEVLECCMIDVYGTGTKKLYKQQKLKEGQLLTVDNYSSAMSVNLIINKNIVDKVGMFDENLWVGNYYGAGEDVDFFLRCIKIGAIFNYTQHLWNYHPLNLSKNSKFSLIDLKRRYDSYGRGQIYMLLKHNMRTEALKCTFNGFLGSIVAFFSGNIKLSLARMSAFITRFITLLKNF